MTENILGTGGQHYQDGMVLFDETAEILADGIPEKGWSQSVQLCFYWFSGELIVFLRVHCEHFLQHQYYSILRVEDLFRKNTFSMQ